MAFSAKFVNTTDKIIIPNNTNLICRSAKTVETWFYFDVASVTGKYCDFYGLDDSLAFYIKSSDNYFGARDDTTANATQAFTYNSAWSLFKQWTHIAFVFDGSASGGTSRLVLNGTTVASATNRGNTLETSSDANHFIGYWSTVSQETGTRYFSDFRIWNTARTDAQITANKNIRLNGNETGLVGYWKLNEPSGTTANDTTTNGYNGTLSGCTFSSTVGEPIFIDISGSYFHMSV